MPAEDDEAPSILAIKKRFAEWWRSSESWREDDQNRPGKSETHLAAFWRGWQCGRESLRPPEEAALEVRLAYAVVTGNRAAAMMLMDIFMGCTERLAPAVEEAARSEALDRPPAVIYLVTHSLLGSFRAGDVVAGERLIQYVGSSGGLARLIDLKAVRPAQEQEAAAARMAGRFFPSKP